MNAPQIASGPIREPAHPTCDPWSIVSVVIHHLAATATKSKFGDLRGAVQAAADLLVALDVEPVISPDDDSS